MQDTTITTTRSRRGIHLHAFNHEHNQTRCIGTVAGAVYEKAAQILRQPEPSFCLPVFELRAARDAGATSLRIPGPGGTYAIDLDRFERYGVDYFHPSYGRQLRCAIAHFQYISKKAKRTAIMDNPPIPQDREILPKKGWRNLDLFSR